MRDEIKWFIYCAILGGSLIAYSHSQFAPKDAIADVKADIRQIRNYLMPHLALKKK